MKIVYDGFLAVVLLLGLIFTVAVLSLPFAWRLGSTPTAVQWLRQRLPNWLLEKLRRVDADEKFLWVHFTRWVSRRAWLSAVVVSVLYLIVRLSIEGLH